MVRMAEHEACLARARRARFGGDPLARRLPLAIAAMLILSAATGAQPASQDAPEPRQPAASATTQQRLPVEAYAERPFLSSPLLSPDGTRIAGRVTSGEREMIGVWRLSDSRDAEPQAVRVANIESFDWAGPDRLLVTSTYTSVHVVGSTFLWGPAQQVLIHELSSGESRPIATDGAIIQQIIFLDPAARYVLAARLGPRDRTPGVDRIDLSSGTAVRVQEPVRGVWSWFADNEGVVRVGIDYGERRTRIYYRAGPNAELARLETREDLLQDSVVDLVRFVSDGRGVMGTNAATGRFALYEYDFGAASRGAALFEHGEVDVTGAIFGPDGSLDGAIYEDDRRRTHWIDPAMSRLQAMLDATLPGKSNVIVNRSDDGNRMLIFSSAADDLGTYYVFDLAARRLEIFASPYERLQGQAFAPVRPVSFRSRDGLTIRGYLTLPSGGGRGLPLIVLPHGGPFLRDSWTFNPDVQFLASRGYAVLQPNFRGSTGYGRDFVERGYGQLGTGMIDDMDDGVDWLVQEGIVDPRRVCIMGYSYGGYAAIWGAMRNPQRYRCAVSWAGPTDLLTMLRRDARLLYATRYLRERRRQLRGDEEVSLRAVSPLRHPERLQVPLLIGHGEQDERVPVDQSRDLVRALERRNIPVDSVFYRKSGHDFGSPEDTEDFLRRVEAFLLRHNPPG